MITQHSTKDIEPVNYKQQSQENTEKEKAKQQAGQAKRPPNLSTSLSTEASDKYFNSQLKATIKTTQYETKRIPWTITCQSWIKKQQYLVFNANPESARWTMPLRGTVSKQRAGQVLHIWKNKYRDSYFDEPRLELTFQSGNILTVMPVVAAGTTINAENIVIKEGLYNFYKFIELLEEPKILPDGTINTVYINYNSQLFPSMMLSGFFDPSQFSFTDGTSKSALIENWSSTFIVMDTFPKMQSNQIANMIAGTFNLL